MPAKPLTLLIVGFGPFPGAPHNPTGALAMRLARAKRPREAARIGRILPTTFAGAEEQLARELEEHRPDIVLMLGLAARAPRLRIEARARNAASFLFPDAEGRRPVRAIIDRRSGPVITARTPPQALLRAVRAARVPVRLSHDAGRYICNLAYWRALAFAADGARPLVQFVHIPRIPRGTRPRRHGKRRIGSGDVLRAAEALLSLLAGRARAARSQGCVRARRPRA